MVRVPDEEANVLLEARDIRVTLPAQHDEASLLHGVDLDVEPGDFLDVAGPSGSGKTTLVRALARLMPGATGTLKLDGVAAESIAPEQWRSHVALLPQQPAIFPGSVKDNLLVPWRLKLRRHDTSPTDAEMAANLDDVRLDVELDRDATRLSVGQRARVALLRVMLTRPRLILLDEPDAALDEASALAVAQMAARFAEGEGAVVRVRHRASDGFATRRIELERGQVREVSL